ncbi:MAG TPA: GWxTD domain-containing protein [Acidobacteriota bacterium]|nr:GWxTD domain-containing protein [Acidobacteriota bacterium]
MTACIKPLISNPAGPPRPVARLAIMVAVSLVLLVGTAWAQGESLDLAVYTRATVYNNPEYDTMVLVDFPFTLNRDQFEFYQPDSLDPEWYARIYAQVTLFGPDGLLLDSASTYFSARTSSAQEAAAPDFMLFNRLSLLVRPGVYSGRLVVIDVVSKREGTFFLDQIVAEPARRDELTIGGGSLAYRIGRAGEGQTSDPMVLNGLRVLTNPLGVVELGDTSVYLYAELYNLTYAAGDSSGYRLEYAVLDNTGAVYRRLGQKVRVKPGPSAVVAEQFDIRGLPAGRYRLQVVATDQAVLDADTALFNLAILPEASEGLALGEDVTFDPYDTLLLDVREKLVAYILTSDQKLALSRLTPEGRSTFLDQFWRDRDASPGTRLIENRLETIKRFEFCNQYFSTDETRSNGWTTDRGRIYMTYGPWDDRDDVSAPHVGNPFVIWYYYSIGEGAVFVFEDKRGYHDYTLAHSNVDGERYSEEWKERLQQGGYRLE